LAPGGPHQEGNPQKEEKKDQKSEKLDAGGISILHTVYFSRIQRKEKISLKKAVKDVP
jgi:hypothetical protein